MKKIGLLIALLGLVMMGTGCLYGSQASESTSGRQISESTLNQIEKGETTREWLIAVAGSPTSTRKIDASREILEYAWSRKTEKKTAILFIAATDNETERSGRTYFEVENGIIQKFWQEIDQD